MDPSWAAGSQRTKGPLPQLPGPHSLAGRSNNSAQGSHRGRGNEIFETIRHAPPAPQSRAVGTSADSNSRGHARDRAGHGTELQQASTTSRDDSEDPLEGFPAGPSVISPLAHHLEADQFAQNGMDDMMLDSVIIPALDNVSRVKILETLV